MIGLALRSRGNCLFSATDANSGARPTTPCPGRTPPIGGSRRSLARAEGTDSGQLSRALLERYRYEEAIH